jgi:hypothetical protein
MEDLKKMKVKNWKEAAKKNLERLGWEGENPQRVVMPNDDDDENVVKSPDLFLFAVMKGCETKGVGWSDYGCTASRALCKVHSYIKFMNSDYKPLGNNMMTITHSAHCDTTQERSFPAPTDSRTVLYVCILIKFWVRPMVYKRGLTIVVLTQRYVPREVENRRWNRGETSGWGAGLLNSNELQSSIKYSECLK